MDKYLAIIDVSVKILTFNGFNKSRLESTDMCTNVCLSFPVLVFSLCTLVSY